MTFVQKENLIEVLKRVIEKQHANKVISDADLKKIIDLANNPARLKTVLQYL